MEKNMEEMVGLLKTMEESVNIKFEELLGMLNNVVDEIKRKQRYNFRCT